MMLPVAVAVRVGVGATVPALPYGMESANKAAGAVKAKARITAVIERIGVNLLGVGPRYKLQMTCYILHMHSQRGIWSKSLYINENSVNPERDVHKFAYNVRKNIP